MPALPNHKHELFAQGLAQGLSADAAYQAAGYKPNRGNAATLKANQSISDRVSELQSKAAEKVVLDRAWVLERLMRNARIAMGEEKVKLTLKNQGNSDEVREIEVTDRDATAANKALELLGKTEEVQLFADRVEVTGRNGEPLLKGIDRPPDETREEWLARRTRELGLGAVMGATARPTNGRDHS